MSCKTLKLNSCEILGSTFSGRTFNFPDRNISQDEFTAKVKGFAVTNANEVINGVVAGNSVLFSKDSLSNLKSGRYVIEYWADFKDVANEMIALEEFLISTTPCACTDDSLVHDFTLEFPTETIEYSVENTITNINYNSYLNFEDLTLEQRDELSFKYSDFTPDELADLRFKFESFTPAQLDELRGKDGKDFKFEDFTPEQLQLLKGKDFTFDDFTPEQLELLKGDKGKAFEYSDFTPAQLALLKGADGKSAYQIWLDDGNVGSVTVFLNSLKGADGSGTKLPLYSAIKSANIVAGTQFIDDENGNVIYRVKTGQTLLTTENPANAAGTKVDIISGGTNSIINVTAEYPLTAGNYYTFSTATVAVPSNRRTTGAIVTYQTAIDNWETATFTGTVTKWTEQARWVIEKITHSKINLVTSNAIETGRRAIRAKVEGGKSYVVSNKLTFDAHYTSGYLDSTGTKVGESGYNTAAIFDTTTNRYYKKLTLAAPETAVELYYIFSADTDNTEFMVEEYNSSRPSYYEHPVLNETFVRTEVNNRAMAKKVENIYQLPETIVSSKNLYNPYTRIPIRQNADGTNQYTSDFIEVEEGAQYYYTRPTTLNSYYYQVFDVNKVLTKNVFFPYVTIGVGEKYVKLLQVNGSTDTTATNQVYEKLSAPIQLEKSKLPTVYEPRFQLADYMLKNSIAKKYRSTLQGKVCYYLGDSITNGGAWSSVVHSELGFSNTADRSGNLGRDGSQWTDTVNTGVSTNNNIKDRIDALEIAITALGVPPDVIIIALGTNDWGNNKPVGDYATAMAKNYADVSARTTVFDAIKYGITRLKKLYSNAFIVINTPIQRAGKYDTIYVDAIKDAAKMMSTPIIDVYAKSGVVPYDEWLTTYYSDGLHITAAGGVQVGKYVANELLNLYYKKST